MCENKYPEIYKRLFHKEKELDEDSVQKAWEKVDRTWKEIIINLQKTQDALSKSEEISPD
ncbi:MAG: hypothetical protein QNJ31_09325 [Candidatus Caenarcaniphilales bacterium]|nr:hypothetical protein [Candidatus Caenarcaniphilales bacterium]